MGCKEVNMTELLTHSLDGNLYQKAIGCFMSVDFCLQLGILKSLRGEFSASFLAPNLIRPQQAYFCGYNKYNNITILVKSCFLIIV